MSRRRITAPVVAAVLVLTLAAGCSGSDSSDAKDSDAKTTTTAKGSGTTTTSEGDDDATGTTSADGATSTTTAGTDIDDLELSGDFCDKTRQLQEGNFFADTTTDTSPEGQIAAVQEQFRIYAALYGQMADGAPDEIAEHVQVWADAASSNYDKVKAMTTLDEVTELQTEFSSAAGSGELQAASDAIEAYLEETCGITQQ